MTAKSSTLKDSEGRVLSSERKAETLAEYLEHVQWAVRPIDSLSSDAFVRPMIDVNCGEISFAEFKNGVSHIKHNKQCCADDFPGEFWK